MDFSCECSGKVFGAHLLTCPVKNGKYTMTIHAASSDWDWDKYKAAAHNNVISDFLTRIKVIDLTNVKGRANQEP